MAVNYTEIWEHMSDDEKGICDNNPQFVARLFANRIPHEPRKFWIYKLLVTFEENGPILHITIEEEEKSVCIQDRAEVVKYLGFVLRYGRVKHYESKKVKDFTTNEIENIASRAMNYFHIFWFYGSCTESTMRILKKTWKPTVFKVHLRSCGVRCVPFSELMEMNLKRVTDWHLSLVSEEDAIIRMVSKWLAENTPRDTHATIQLKSVRQENVIKDFVQKFQDRILERNGMRSVTIKSDDPCKPIMLTRETGQWWRLDM